MKKLILILLFITGYLQAQTLQNPTFGIVTIKNSPTVTSVNFLTGTEATGVQSKIDPVNLPFLSKTNALKIYNSNKIIYRAKRKAVFSFIWDDLQDSDQLVYNVFQDFGYLPSYALKTDVLNGTNKDLYVDLYQKGCSILAHSVSHPDMSTTSISYANVNIQMVNSKKAIEAYGMRVSGWVTPNSTLHSSFYPLVDKNFGYAFTNTGGAFNETVDPLRMSRVGLESAMANHNLANVKAIIDDAITNGKLIVFYGHHLPSTYLNPDTTPYLTEADLRDILAYLKTKSDENLCEVLPTDEAIHAYMELNALAEGSVNYVPKWTGTRTQKQSQIYDNGTSVGVSTTTPVGKLNINTGTTTTTVDIVNQQNGSISFANGGGTSYTPTIVSKSDVNTGLYIQSATSDVNAAPDMIFNVRRLDDSDYTIFTSPAYTFKRNSANLFEILRNGNIGYGGLGNTGIKHFFYSAFTTAYAATGTGINAAGDFYINNSSNTDNTSAIIRLGTSNANTQSAQGYFGLINTSTNYESILVWGQRSGASTWNERMRLSAAGNFIIGSTTDASNGTLQVTGNASGSLAASNSAHFMRKGEFDTADGNNVKLTGTQSITGQKNFSSSTSGVAAIGVSTATASNGISITNNSTGLGIIINNVSNGVSQVLNSQTGSSGDLLQFSKNNVTTSKIDQNGNYVKIGGTSSQLLVADGSVNTILTSSGTLDFPSTAANAQSSLTLSVVGSVVGDVISLGSSVPAAGCMYYAYVSAADTVTIRFINMSLAAVDPASSTFKVKVLK